MILVKVETTTKEEYYLDKKARAISRARAANFRRLGGPGPRGLWEGRSRHLAGAVTEKANTLLLVYWPCGIIAGEKEVR